MSGKICYGTWGFDGRSYGSISFQDGANLICRAIEKGIDLFDTSDFYGYGRSELILGEVRAMGMLKNSCRVATKAGLLPHSKFDMPNDFSRKHLENSLLMSLSRLGVEDIDIWQLHSPSVEHLIDISKNFKWFEDLKKGGVISKIGISARSPSDALKFLNEFPFDIVQVNFNLLDQRILDINLNDVTRNNGVELIVRTPLAFGFLSGYITHDTKFNEFDHRSKWPKKQLKKWSEGIDMYSDIRNQLQLSKAEFSLLYARSITGINYVNVGMMKLEEIEDNKKIFDSSPMSQDVLMSIREIYLRSEFANNNIAKVD